MSTARYSFANSGADPFSEDPSLQPANTPIWREAMFPLDWIALRSSPVYYGCGVPHGNGEPVVLVPGFLASDASLMELYWWLARVGYNSVLLEHRPQRGLPGPHRRASSRNG